MQHKTVVITGAAKGIGKALATHFQEKGANVATIDILPNPYFVGNVGVQADLEAFAQKVIEDFGSVDVLINNALPAMHGIASGSYEDFNEALRVGVTAPYYLTKLFMPYFAKGASIINLSSTRAFMSQPQTESYSAAKGGITALTHAMAVSLSGRVRVNAIAPGWIDTTEASFQGADNDQHPVGRVGKPEDIVAMADFLASEGAGFITGQTFTVDGGMTKLMIYHQDHGWQRSEEG